MVGMKVLALWEEKNRRPRQKSDRQHVAGWLRRLENARKVFKCEKKKRVFEVTGVEVNSEQKNWF